LSIVICTFFRLWPFSREAASLYARLFADLRRAGRTVHAMDLMIAAITLNLGSCTLVTNDTDFAAVPSKSCGAGFKAWGAVATGRRFAWLAKNLLVTDTVRPGAGRAAARQVSCPRQAQSISRGKGGNDAGETAF
jgi:hypothetical protein